MVEGREDARPVVTPSQPQVGALSVQEKEMMEAAKRKEEEKKQEQGGSDTLVQVADATTAANNDAHLAEATVPAHLQHDASSTRDDGRDVDSSPSPLPHIYGHGKVVDNDAVNPALNLGGIDGYDDPGNLFVRSAHGTPKYAGRRGNLRPP